MHLFALSINAEQIGLHKLSTDTSFAQDLRRYRNSITSGEMAEFVGISYDLYDRVACPLAPSIRGDKILIVQDGILNHIPFEPLLTQHVADPENGYRQIETGTAQADRSLVIWCTLRFNSFRILFS